ncbi:MAG: hypothetical protein NZM31_05925 [Gemmatales bacterium]|nr:hypothetical protein [Gemmatales bacterium]MDW8386536.1 hypothetical protein [Gemmatales bacterium]
MLPCWLCVVAVGIVVGPPEDEQFQSENSARSVRPAAFGKVAPEADHAGNRQAAKNEPAAEKGEEIRLFKAEQVAELKAQQGKTVRVVGKVHSIYVPPSGRVCIFNMGPDHRTCFKITIPSAAWEKWPGGLDDLRKLDKKTVTVEGRVRLYQDLPEIVVNVPSQLREQEPAARPNGRR